MLVDKMGNMSSVLLYPGCGGGGGLALRQMNKAIHIP
jgi:hypothetical protein